MLGVVDQNINLHTDLYNYIKDAVSKLKFDLKNTMQKEIEKELSSLTKKNKGNEDKKAKENEIKIFFDNEYKSDIQKYKNLARTIPKLIRKNGLILTLSYLSKKSSNKNEDNIPDRNNNNLHKTISNHIINYLNKNAILSNQEIQNEIKSLKPDSNDNYSELLKIFLNKTDIKETDTEFFNDIRNCTLALLKFFDIYLIILEGVSASEEFLDE